ncbi:UNVERIFIED_CONTAM: hypothetical protein HDU68_009223 [Siphonaria sp. JEL0065]|nr:hypothetical protein HDU68_009223 [Siphonaria sp. JEL0065]
MELEGPTCGLIPMSGRALVETTGLKWNLDHSMPMSFHEMISTSNWFADGDEKVKVVEVVTDMPLVWTVESTTMSTFALCVIGLTLPSLASQNYQRLGLAEPPLSPSYTSKCMMLRIGVTDKLEDMRIISPAYTVFTHMFHHRDFNHWFSNMYALVVVTAGSGKQTIGKFFEEAFTFFGGGLTGVLGHIVYTTVQRRRQPTPIKDQLTSVTSTIEDSVNWALNAVTGSSSTAINLKLPVYFVERTCILVGASAGVYALMGAECIRIGFELSVELRKLARLERRQYLDYEALKERTRIKNNIVNILTGAIGHAVAIGSQVVAIAGLFDNSKVIRTGNDGYTIVHNPQNSSTLPGGASVPQVQVIDESIGYAAHLGGFLFGVSVQIPMTGDILAKERIEAISNHLSDSNTTSTKVFRSELSPLSLLWRTVSLFPARNAFVHAQNNNAACSYEQFGARIKQFAVALQAKAGLVKGEKVAVLVPNSPVILEANFGVPLAGGVLVSINSRLLQDEVEYILKLSKARVLFVDKELEHLTANWKGCGVRIRIISADLYGLENAKSDPYEQFLADAARAASSKSLDSFPRLENEEDTIAINFTSGTTGKPKGVMYHYRGAYLNALCMVVEMGMTVETNYLWILPMFHASGWCFPWAVSAVGGCHTLLRKVDYGQIWDLLLNSGITAYCAAPTVQLAIVNHPAAKPLPKPVKTMVAAAPPSPTLLEAMLKLKISPIHVYGLTETFGPATICTWQPEWSHLGPHELAEKLSRQGHAFLASDEVLVLDPKTGKPVPNDGVTLGEVAFRGNLVMTGYLDDENATAEAFRGGFFHSGDVAVKHKDGYIELRDRQKDIIISGGENISTIEIENAIMSHSSILETCVVSSPDAQWGERPVAYVTLKSPVKDEAAFINELLVYLKTKLAGFKMPVRVHILAELPKTSTGKIQKYVLRAEEWKKQGVTGGKMIN